MYLNMFYRDNKTENRESKVEERTQILWNRRAEESHTETEKTKRKGKVRNSIFVTSLPRHSGKMESIFWMHQGWKEACSYTAGEGSKHNHQRKGCWEMRVGCWVQVIHPAGSQMSPFKQKDGGGGEAGGGVMVDVGRKWKEGRGSWMEEEMRKQKPKDKRGDLRVKLWTSSPNCGNTCNSQGDLAYDTKSRKVIVYHLKS